MKLLNQSLKYLSFFFFLIIGSWAIILYYSMLDEVYDSIDDGLDNYKLLILKRVIEDESVLLKSNFNESNYLIKEIPQKSAILTKDVFKDTLMYMENEQDLEPVRMLKTAFAHNNKFYELKILSSMVEEDDLIEDLTWGIFWLYLTLLLSIILVNNFVLKRIWSPFYLTLNQIKNFKLGSKESFKKTDTKINEFIALEKATENLIEHTSSTYNNQKQFIENASHEIQTPLAIAINKTELLLENGSLKTEDANRIADILSTLERLTKLNKSLLLISKIENKQFNENKNTNLTELTSLLINDFEVFATHKNIKINYHSKENLLLNIDENLANIMLSNLIKNAINHGNSNSEINITTTTNSFVIINKGKNEPLSENIFTRFYKDSSNIKNTGLGLSIVNSIVKLYQFNIEYAFNKGEHKFIVTFNH